METSYPRDWKHPAGVFKLAVQVLNTGGHSRDKSGPGGWWWVIISVLRGKGRISLRFKKIIDSFQGFIEIFSLFSNRSEAIGEE